MSKEVALGYLATSSGNKIDADELRSSVSVIYDDMPNGAASVNLGEHAVGDGITDDTDAIKTVVANLKSGMTLFIPAGKTFKHTDNIIVSGLANITMTGGGTIAHIGDADSSGGWAFEGCYNVTVENVTLTSTATTRRSGDYSHRLFFYQCGAVRVRNVTINGSAAAGILLDTTDGFTIERCTISHTLADSLHMTHESKNGVIDNIVSDYSGDDGIAVVSYDSRPTRVQNVQISNVTITNQLWGRGISVVGGLNIHYRDCYVSKSAAAGIYVAAEAGFETQGVNNCSFTNITLDQCVQQASDTPELRPRPEENAIKHGAITVWRGRLDPYTLTDVSFVGITITNTQVDAYSDVQLVTYDPANKQPARLSFSNFTITQIDPHNALDANNIDLSTYNTKNWVVNGVPLEDHIWWVDTTATPILSSGGRMTGALNLSNTAPEGAPEAAPKSYVDLAVRGNGVLFGALYTVIEPTSEPSSDINGQVSIEDQGSSVWKLCLQRVLSDGTNVLQNFTNIEALGYENYEIVLVHEDGKFVRLSPNTSAYLNDPYNVSAWFCSVVSGDASTFPTSGKCSVFFQETPTQPSSISVTTAAISSHLTVTSGSNVLSAHPTYLRVTDGVDTSNVYANYISSGIAYLDNVQATGASVVAFDTIGRQAVKSGAISIVRNSSNDSSTIIAAYPTAADEATGSNAYFELRGSGAMKIGPAVNSDDAVQKSQVKAIAAASSDFADFKTRMAAW